LPKNASFEAKNARCPCFIFQGCFQKPILLTDDSTTGVNIGTGIGDALAGLGNGLASVIDSVNPVDDFMDNIKQVIIIVVIQF
jgi:hypothetical protein